MLALFKSSLFARIFAITTLGIVLLFVVMYGLAVPYIQNVVAGIEERAGQTILNNVYAMVEEIHSDLDSGRQSILQERKASLRNMIELVSARAKMLDQKVRAKELSRAQAKRLLLDELQYIKYGRGDYIFAVNYQSVTLSHGDTKLIGVDFSKIRDARGQLIVPPMVAGALKDGDGFYSYWWLRQGEPESTEKLSYYQHIPAFEMVIGSGVYLDDINQAMHGRRKQAIEKLRTQLLQTRIARTGYVYIFDSKEFMLIHPNSNIEGRDASDQIDHATGKPILPMLKMVADRPEGMRYVWDSPADPGNYVYQKISWVRYVKEFDWYIGSSVYVDELNESALVLRNRVLAVFVITLLISIVLIYFFVKKLTYYQVSEERSKFALEGSNNGVWDWNLQTNDVFFSKTWKEMFGYVESDVITNPDWVRMMHPDDVEFVQSTLGDYFAGKIPPPTLEFRLRCKGGGWKWVMGRGNIVSYTGAGQPLRMVGTNSDIDERKRMEAELKQAYEELKQLDQLKSDFLSTISHELRTPMTSVVGFVKLVKKKLEAAIFPQVMEDQKTLQAMAQVRQNLDIVVGESERLTLLINDVLDSVKLEADKVDWNFAAVQPQQLIERAKATTAALVEQSGLELVTELMPDLPPVRGDESRLLQVMINLIGNAVKFTETGTIRLSAELLNGFVEFSVQDTGQGIAEDDQSRVFDKFKQLGDTMTDKPRGSGLGLSICQQIVTYHGGRIWVQSSSGLGSRFYFTVPILTG